MKQFDYESIALEAKIPREQVDEICRLMREECPVDEMLYELHVLRACMAIRDGNVTVEQVLHSSETSPA